ncbi:hypothetical protein [Teredinibacter sp. KSP-S5-2]|uniref:hypothetical protein n=1 Tax=Teredinibacter sp. KSP-S5-2 TaxID=3034506 RepID=UPI0029342D5D|nr:hypothetical protein [Teredinibacter sp. KSP-S5-2]WNO09947.1 hypothetical protein P5V12_02055 [Teredinibacter sp. KSP-S5-2]
MSLQTNSGNSITPSSAAIMPYTSSDAPVKSLTPYLKTFNIYNFSVTGPRHFSDQSQNFATQLNVIINTSLAADEQNVFINLATTTNINPGPLIHNTVDARGFGVQQYMLSAALRNGSGNSFSSSQLSQMFTFGIAPQNLNQTIGKTTTSSYSTESGIVVGESGGSPVFESSVSVSEGHSVSSTVDITEWAVVNQFNLEQQSGQWTWYQNAPFSPFAKGGVNTFPKWWGDAYNNGNDDVISFPNLTYQDQTLVGTLTWQVPVSLLSQDSKFQVHLDSEMILFMLLGTKYGGGHHQIYTDDYSEHYDTDYIDTSSLFD